MTIAYFRHCIFGLLTLPRLGYLRMGGGQFEPISNFKTITAIDMKLLPRVDNYKMFRFYLFLENCILLPFSNDVIKFEKIEIEFLIN